MDMNSIWEKYKDFFSLTFITSVLYFCGYLSSDYYTRVLGIRIDYDALDIIKWGADFFLYTVIDFFANIIPFIVSLGKDWLRIVFLMLICLDVFILIMSRRNKAATTNNSAISPLYKRMLTCWSCLFCAVVVVFSIYFLTRFIGKTDLEYKKIMELGDIYVVYSSFIVLNLLNIVNIKLLIRESNMKYFLLLPLLFLPALYGVYGRNYNFNCVHKTDSETALLLESHNGKNYIIERKYNCGAPEIVKNRCYDVQYKYKIIDEEDYVLSLERYNFFDFIRDRYNENNESFEVLELVESIENDE